MADPKPTSAVDKPSPPPPPPTQPPKSFPGSGSSSNGSHHHHAPHGFPNPPDAANPDAATLREQWRFAVRQYSRWYSQAWGTAILAGLSFFALGWVIKGSNPLPSRSDNNKDEGK
ncbi:transmembrane protein [Rhynchospora pubera]|uniref:Transmembrane protein n=1 Tax=Rhynchospora pubera TaxID=906938 RepID=A0AAV8GT16_9POAL|nr:transmembrane protein [Rhynchospora pubera]